MADKNDDMFNAEELMSLLDEIQTGEAGINVINNTDDLTDVISKEIENLSNENVPARHYIHYNIDDYDPKIYSDQQLKEIRIGIEHKLQVDEYSSVELSGRQMREIRYGLERGLDVSFYKNKYFRERQMKEIRIGLQDNLDVSSYAKLLFSATDMHKKRMALFREKYSENMDSLSYDYDDKDTGIHIYVEPGLMEAGIVINNSLPEKFTRFDLKKLMAAYDITEGYREALIPQNLSNLPKGVKIPIMFGKDPVPGRNGYFEYNFEAGEDNRPKVMEDGSVDYSPEKFYKMVKRGEKIVTFHPSIQGSNGLTVTGMEVKGTFGEDPEPLTSEDLLMSRDKLFYMAKKDGFVSIVNGQVRIMDNLVFNEDVTYYNGVINYDGSIQIKGSVRDRAEIHATGDIVVSGHVESATLAADGDIIISGGVNSDEVGSLVAKGSIKAGFFENTNVIAGGNIETGYVLNSNVYAGGYVRTKGKRALICGGIITGREGVFAGTIGSNAGTKTTIEVGGMDDKENDQYMKLTNIKKSVDAEIEKIQIIMSQMVQKLGVLKVKTDENYNKLIEVLESKKENRVNIQKDISLLDNKRLARANTMIEVTNEIFENVQVSVNGNKMLTKEKSERARIKTIGRQVIIDKLD